MKAVALMKARGGRIIFDVDYRPVLWGLAAKDNGEDRFIADARVTGALQQVLPLVDLVVGTEEEIHILGGATDTVAALRAIRNATDALLVCKRGALGCVAFDRPVPDRLDDGIVGRGFAVEVFNVLGAGDAFMAGFLRGWLRGEDIATCCDWANACGAIVVSRHGCAPAMASWTELQHFLGSDAWPYRLRDSAELEQLHWSTNRPRSFDELTVLAIDHRSQFDDLLEELGGGDPDRVSRFKGLALAAVDRLAQGNPHFGLLLDGRYGARPLEATAELPYWVGRPIEVPGSRPIEFEGHADIGASLREWPSHHVVKCLLFYHPDDAPALRAAQDGEMRRLFDACRSTRHELLLEIIASKHGAVDPTTVARVIEHIYGLGIYPDWWKLEPTDDPAAWTHIEAAIAGHDPHCRGVVLLGLSASTETLLASFGAAAPCNIVKGFAVGRTIWQDVARRWLSGEIDDEATVAELAGNLRHLVDAWQQVRRSKVAA
jgi:5-dehydro-2-deoxygluconokinase